MNSDSVGYTSVCAGDASFLRALPIPLASDLEVVAKEAEIKHENLPTIDVFAVDKRPKNLGLESAVAAGIILFVGSWFAKKLLDEIYDLKLKPVIRRVIQKSDEITIFGKKKRSFVFLVGVYYRDEEKLVLVALKAKDKAVLVNDLERIRDVHTSAYRKLTMPEYDRPLHLYVLENGQANVEPIQLRNMQEAYETIAR